MKGIMRMWWVPLVPVSYYSSYKLTEIPPGHNPFDSLTYILTRIPQKVREEQFKTCHLYSEFIRLKRGRKSDIAGELQTSIVRYQEKSPNQLFNRRKLRVDLVGVMHIGDKRYYQAIQQRLRMYDCVLYEGPYVNSADVKEVTAAKQRVNLHQKGADKYGLVRQNSVLFQGKNWKNADLTSKTYLQLEEERLNRWWKEYEKNQEGRKIIRITQIELARLKHVLTVCSLCLPLPAFVPLITYLTCSRDAPNCHDIDQLEEMFKLGFLHYYVEDSNFSDAYKMVYKYDVDYEGNSDFASKAVVMRERNKFVMEVLKETIAEGKTSIAVLYGAGHMADFHKRLVKELDMVPVSVSWFTAWSIKEGPKSKFIHPLLENFQIENRTIILGLLFLLYLLGIFGHGEGLDFIIGLFLGSLDLDFISVMIGQLITAFYFIRIGKKFKELGIVCFPFFLFCSVVEYAFLVNYSQILSISYTVNLFMIIKKECINCCTYILFKCTYIMLTTFIGAFY